MLSTILAYFVPKRGKFEERYIYLISRTVAKPDFAAARRSGVRYKGFLPRSASQRRNGHPYRVDCKHATHTECARRG